MRILRKAEIASIPSHILFSECASGYGHYWVAWFTGFACYHCQIKSLTFGGEQAVLKNDLKLIHPDKLRSLCAYGDGNHWWKKVGDGKGHLLIYCHYCAGDSMPEDNSQSCKRSRRTPPWTLVGGTDGRHSILSNVTSTSHTVPMPPLWCETGGRCVYCDRSPDPYKRSRDHIWPRSKGGTFHAKNMLPACRECNSNRGVIWPPSSIAHPKWREYVAVKEASEVVKAMMQAFEKRALAGSH